MKKIPVGATIAHAYRFVFTKAPLLLRAMWLPLLAQLVLAYFLIKRSALFLAAAQARDPSMVTLFGPLLLLTPAVVVLFFVQLTAAMETALGSPPQGWFVFPIGRKMWRLLGGFLAALIAIAVAGMVALLVLWVIGIGLDMIVIAAPGTRAAMAVLVGLLIAAWVCGLFFLAIRFLFLLAPSNLSRPAGSGLGLREAWHLSAGNFWRALLIIFAILLPPWLINFFYQVAIAGWPPQQTAGISREAAETAWRISELNAVASHWYFTFPLLALLMLFQFGAGCAAQVFAVRALTEDEASAPVAGG